MSRTLRVVLDGRSVFPGMGGIGRSTAMLAAGLARLSGVETILLEGSRPPASPIAGVRHVPSGGAMIDPVFDQFMLPALLEDLNADVYHGTCFSVPAARTEVAYVATIHDVVFRRLPDLVEPGLRDFLDRSTALSCERADAVVTVSEFSRREIAALYGRDETTIDVVPNAVEERFLEEKHAPSDHPPYFLYVGAIERKKSTRALLEGFGRFLQLQPGSRHELWLAGSAEPAHARELQAYVDEWPRLRERVRMLGHTPDAELPGLYAGATAFAYLSVYEGFGLPPLEAMAAGVPTLVADLTSLPEVTRGAALTVDPSSADAVGRALCRLTNDAELRTRLVKEGREVARTYTVDAAAEKVRAVYERAFAERRQPALVGGAA